MSKVCRIICLFILSLSVLPGVPVLQARSAGAIQRTQFPRRVQAAFDKRESKIKEELESLPLHDWAGVYAYGGGVGSWGVFTLAPTSGFVVMLGGCTGVYSLNYGTIVEENGVTKLLTGRPLDQTHSWRPIIEMLPVRWGERHYLLSNEEVIDFCNAINSCWEPDRLYGGFFLLRRGDETKPVTGMPGIPEQYRQYLLPSPIQATIIALHSSRIEIVNDVSEMKERTTKVTLSAGYTEGLRVGMELQAFEPRNFESAKVVQVFEHTAEAEMRQHGADGEIPQVGWTMSTGRRE